MNESREQRTPAESSDGSISSQPAETQNPLDSADVREPGAADRFPITDRGAKNKPPLTAEEKKKVWVRRIIGAIVFFSVLGSLALLAAAQAVTFLFKIILSP